MPALLISLLVLLLGAPAAAAPKIHTLFIDEEPLPGTRLPLGFVHGVAVNNDGDWAINTLGLTIRSGSLWVRPGDPIVTSGPNEVRISYIGTVNLNNDGRAAWYLALEGGTTNRALAIDRLPILHRDDPATAAGLVPGTTYEHFGKSTLRPNDSRHVLSFLTVDQPGIGGTPALVEIHVDGRGGVLSERVVAKRGDLLPNQRSPVTGFPAAGDGEDGFAYNDAGQVLFYVALGDPTPGTVLYLDDEILAQEGQPSIIPGRNWDFDGVQEPAVDLNNAGDTVFKGRLDGSWFGRRVIVKNGEVFVRQDIVYPDIAPNLLNTLGPEGTSLKIDDAGRVYWFGDFGGTHRGLLRDHEWVARNGTVTEEGHTLANVWWGPGAFDASDNGRWIIFKAFIEPSTFAVFLADLGEEAEVPAEPRDAHVVTRLAGSPNPTAGVTTIEFRLREERRLRLQVLDVHGRQVRDLGAAFYREGTNTARWDGRDGNGSRVAEGVYFIRLTGDGVERTEKVTVLRGR